MRNRHRSRCGCPRPNCGCPVKEVIHPVKCNVVHCNSEETIKHVHPSHTTVVNHHLIKNEHVFPHSTSFENTVNEVDVFGGAFNTTPAGPGSQVGGAMSPPPMGSGNQVGGPGMGTGRPPFGSMPGQVGGAMSPGMCHGSHHHGVGGVGHGKKPPKWC